MNKLTLKELYKNKQFLNTIEQMRGSLNKRWFDIVLTNEWFKIIEKQ